MYINLFCRHNGVKTYKQNYLYRILKVFFSIVKLKSNNRFSHFRVKTIETKDKDIDADEKPAPCATGLFFSLFFMCHVLSLSLFVSLVFSALSYGFSVSVI